MDRSSNRGKTLKTDWILVVDEGNFDLDRITYEDDSHTKEDPISLSHNQHVAVNEHMKGKGGEFLVGQEFDDLLTHIIKQVGLEVFINSFHKLINSKKLGDN